VTNVLISRRQRGSSPWQLGAADLNFGINDIGVCIGTDEGDPSRWLKSPSQFLMEFNFKRALRPFAG